MIKLKKILRKTFAFQKEDVYLHCQNETRTDGAGSPKF